MIYLTAPNHNYRVRILFVKGHFSIATVSWFPVLCMVRLDYELDDFLIAEVSYRLRTEKLSSRRSSSSDCCETKQDYDRRFIITSGVEIPKHPKRDGNNEQEQRDKVKNPLAS
jgi:hypothetical protein